MKQLLLSLIICLYGPLSLANVSSSIFLDSSLWVQRSSELSGAEYLFFYAEYCPYCELVLPKVKCLESKVVGIATDKSMDKARLNIKKHVIKFSVYWDQEKELRKKYAVRGVPALVLVAKDPAQNKVWTGQTDVEKQLLALGINKKCE